MPLIPARRSARDCVRKLSARLTRWNEPRQVRSSDHLKIDPEMRYTGGRLGGGKTRRKSPALGYAFLHLAAASGVRWRTGQLPCVYATERLRLPPERIAVATERSTEYFALLTGLIARRICFTGFGVTARLTVRTGCAARRTLRGTSRRLKNPMGGRYVRRYCIAGESGEGVRLARGGMTLPLTRWSVARAPPRPVAADAYAKSHATREPPVRGNRLPHPRIRRA